MIIEGESDFLVKEKDDKKRKAEVTEGTASQRSFQPRFNPTPEFQPGRREPAKRAKTIRFQPNNRFQDPNQSRQINAPAPDCKRCGKKHLGFCAPTHIVCFKCNQDGHYANTCPNVKPKSLVNCFKCGNYGHYAKDCRADASRGNTQQATRAPSTNQPKARTFYMSMKSWSARC